VLESDTGLAFGAMADRLSGIRGHDESFFPQLPRQDWLRAIHWLYREIGPQHSLNMAEVTMHLCWDKRRADGTLDDLQAKTRKRRREA
jgi:hypothetical protein